MAESAILMTSFLSPPFSVMELAFGDCVSLLREPDAANPHVRFDERGVETEA
jgi:hypothetical protein